MSGVNKPKEKYSGGYDKKKNFSKWLVRTGATTIAIGVIVGLVLIENGTSQVGRYILRSCFIVGFVLLFVNVINMSKE